MNNPATLNAMAVALDAKELAAESERSPKLKAAYDAAVSARDAANTERDAAEAECETANAALAAVYAAAKAVTDKLAAQGATIEGAATEIAALIALYPTDGDAGNPDNVQ